MLFTELRFLVFFAIVAAVYWALRRNAGRKAWLLAASYAFYAAWDARFLLLILGSTLVDYVAGQRIAARNDAAGRRAWLVASLAVNLGVLAVFKYFGFFVASAGHLLSWLGFDPEVRTLSIVLPVGISFFTFQSMSYTIDVHQRRLAPTRSFLDFALFVGFFPQLVAGPIVRARGFLPQLAAPRGREHVALRWSLTLFLLGFVKKACIADVLAQPVDAVFDPAARFDAASHWIGTFLYGVQIYCDFSGYSDMAVGCAGLLGYRLVRNFDFPYLALSLRDFWRRWHVSLSTWFRDYLYVPLGGSRGDATRTARNLWAVFLLCGLWHGAAWTFVAWGAWHGALLTLERAGLEAKLARLPRTLRWLYAQGLVCLAWIPFRCVDLDHTGRFLAELFSGPAGAASLEARWLGACVLLAVAHGSNARWRLPRRLAALEPIPFALLLGALAALALAFVPTGHRPFIYFQF